MSKLDKIKEHPPSAVLKSERQEYKTLHNIPKPPSLRARYFALSLLALPPIIVGCALLWFYMQPANGLFYVLLPLFIVSFIVCGIKGVSYYFNVVERVRNNHPQRRKTRTLFSRTNSFRRNLLTFFIYGSMIAFWYSHYIYLFASATLVKAIIFTLLTFVYFLLFLGNNSVKGNISSSSKKGFTVLTSTLVFIIVPILGFFIPLNFILLPFDIGLLCSYIVFRYDIFPAIKLYFIKTEDDPKPATELSEEESAKLKKTTTLKPKKVKKHLKPTASFEEKYEADIIRFIRLINSMGKKYNHHSKRQFYDYHSQHTEKGEEDTPIFLPTYGRGKQAKVDYYTNLSTVTERKERKIKEYEESFKPDSSRIKKLQEKETAARAEINQQFAPELETFMNTHFGADLRGLLTKILLSYSSDVDVVTFAVERKGYKHILRKLGYDFTYFTVLRKYHSKYQQQLAQSMDYPSFLDTISNLWQERIEKFFSGVIEAGEKEYTLTPNTLYTKARNLLKFNESKDLIKFIKNLRQHVYILKVNRYSETFIANFSKILEEVNHEREILGDVFSFARRKSSYSSLLRAQGYSSEIIRNFKHLLKTIEKEYNILRTKVSFRNDFSERESLFLQEQKEVLKTFFKGLGKNEDPYVRSELKIDLNNEFSHYSTTQLFGPKIIEHSHLLTLIHNKKLIEVLLRRKLDHYKKGKEEEQEKEPLDITPRRFTFSKTKEALAKIKTRFLQNTLKYVGLMFTLVGIIFFSFLYQTSSVSFYFPGDIKLLFFLLQVILSFFFTLFFNGWRLIGKRQLLLLSIGFIPLPWIGALCYYYGILEYAQILPFVNIIICYLSSRNLPEIVPKYNQLHITQSIKNASIRREFHNIRYQGVRAYHKNKLAVLGSLLFVLSIALAGAIFLAPQYQLICYGIIFGVVVLFTFKSPRTIRKYIYSRQKASRKDKSRIRRARTTLLSNRDRLARAALLLAIFLTVFPLIFAVNSISTIRSPNFEYAKVQLDQRLEPSSLNLAGLEYSSYLDDLDDLTINDEFVIRCQVSPFIGISSTVRVRLTPIDVSSIEGYYQPPYYEVTSEYITGPKESYQMITHVPLNTLSLVPGIYKVEVFYGELTGFRGQGIKEGTKIEINLNRNDPTSVIEFNKRILSAVHYLSKYPYSFTVVKTNDDKNLLYASLTEILDEEFIRTSFSASPTIIKGSLTLYAVSNYKKWKNGYLDEQSVYHPGWNQNSEHWASGRKLWTSMNIYPIYLFSNANSDLFGQRDYAEWLINFFKTLTGEKYGGIDEILRLK